MKYSVLFGERIPTNIAIEEMAEKVNELDELETTEKVIVRKHDRHINRCNPHMKKALDRKHGHTGHEASKGLYHKYLKTHNNCAPGNKPWGKIVERSAKREAFDSGWDSREEAKASLDLIAEKYGEIIGEAEAYADEICALERKIEILKRKEGEKLLEVEYLEIRMSDEFKRI